MPDQITTPLAESLTQFRGEVSAFAPTKAHFVPDLALRGFLHGVDEHAELVLALSGHPYRDRAFPCSRVAFEYAQHALLLATDNDYDLAGARAWVYYLRKDAELVPADRGPDFANTDSVAPQEWYNAAVKEIAETWDELSPGKGKIVLEAEQMVAAMKRKPDNFLGVQVAAELAKRFNNEAEVTGSLVRHDPRVFNNAYAGLSRDSHARTLLRPVEISVEGGVLRTTFEVPDRDQRFRSAVLAASGAVKYATVALRRRSQLAER